MPRVNIKSVGDYVIEKQLSKGGMSSVHLAYRTGIPDLKVALKLHLETDSENNAFQDLLRKEAEYLKRLRHPGVVRIFPIVWQGDRVTFSARDLSTRETPWYFIMEYLPGGSLAQNLPKIKKYPVSWIIEFFYQLLVTLDFLHDAGYGHCDIKPENILLREPPNPNQVAQPILIDFGTVHAKNKRMNLIPRSIRYSPPEIILAHTRKDISGSQFRLYPDKIDIWAAGAILFEMLTGRPLFNQNKDKDITTSILRGKIDKVSSLRPEVGESLDVLLSVMLKPEPEDRPDAEDIIEAIEERILYLLPPRIAPG